MKPIRSMIPAALTLAALAAYAPAARAQMFYGQGVTGYSYSGLNSFSGSYGFGGVGPTFYGQGFNAGAVYGVPYGGGLYGAPYAGGGYGVPYGGAGYGVPYGGVGYGVPYGGNYGGFNGNQGAVNSYRWGPVNGVTPLVPALTPAIPRLSPRVPTLR